LATRQFVLWVRLVAGMATGLAFGYCAKRAVQRNYHTQWAMIERIVSPVLLLISAAIALWIVPQNGLYNRTNCRAIILLGIYCLSAIGGFIGTRAVSISKRTLIMTMDVFVFGALECMFILLVLANARVPLSELPTYKWSQIAVAAGTFGFSVTLTQHCALTGKWLANLLVLLSASVITVFETLQWCEVMRHGFFYMDMPSSFAYGIELLPTCLLTWLTSMILDISGLIAAYRKSNREAVIAGFVQLALLGLMFWFRLG
jgi:hypothetical protein